MTTRRRMRYSNTGFAFVLLQRAPSTIVQILILFLWVFIRNYLWVSLYLSGSCFVFSNCSYHCNVWHGATHFTVWQWFSSSNSINAGRTAMEDYNVISFLLLGFFIKITFDIHFRKEHLNYIIFYYQT